MLPSPISSNAFSFLMACSLKLTVLLASAVLFAFALRRRSAALRHHLWTAALLASLFLPFLMLLLPAWHSAALFNTASAWVSSRAAAPPVASSATPATIVDASSSNFVGGLLSATPFFWLLGVLVVLSRVLIGLARLAWLRAHVEPLFDDTWMREVLNISNSLKILRPVRLLESRNASTMPLTYGLLRPAILLPAGAAQWPAERRRIVLAHELAHISRHDWALQLGAELACAVYWFHPLVWLAASQLRQESERACDDAVLKQGVSPSLYASQLLDLARALKNPVRAWSTALAIARPTNLERRFAAMLNPSINRTNPSAKMRLLIPFLVLSLLLPLAALRLTAQDRAGKTSGTIHDPSGASIANATIVMTNHDANTIDMTTTDRDGNFSFTGLLAGKYEFQVYKPGFETYTQQNVSLDAGRDFTSTFTLSMGALSEHLTVVPERSEQPSASEKNNGKPSRIKVGGNVEAAQLIKRVIPVYPDSAKSAGIQGIVVLHAVISTDGRPLSLRVVNGQIDPDLAKSAVEAVSQWRYTPTLLNGEPVEVDTTIQVNYTLNP
jgi:TonB family protein